MDAMGMPPHSPGPLLASSTFFGAKPASLRANAPPDCHRGERRSAIVTETRVVSAGERLDPQMGSPGADGSEEPEYTGADRACLRHSTRQQDSTKKGATMGIPATMTATVLVAPHRFELQQRPVPVPGEEDVLVRVRACGI